MSVSPRREHHFRASRGQNVQKPKGKTPFKINLSKHGNGKRAKMGECRRMSWPPRWPKMGPRLRKIAPRGAKTAPRGAKTAPRDAKTGPRGAKTGPRGAQTVPRDVMFPMGVVMFPN